MLKWSLVGAAVLAVLLSVAVERLIDAKADLRVERIRAEQLDGQLAALAERAERAAIVRREGEQLRARLRSETNSDWGTTLVPDNVKRVLCEQADCVAAEPVPPPGDRSDN